MPHEEVVHGLEDIAHGGVGFSVHRAGSQLQGHVIGGGGAVGGDEIQEVRHSQVLGHGACEDGHHVFREERLSQSVEDVLVGKGALIEELLHEGLVGLGDALHQVLVALFRHFAQGLHIPGEGAHHSLEGLLLAIGQGDRHAGLLDAGLLQQLHRALKVRLVLVAAVDENHAGQMEVAGHAPGADGARPDALGGIHHQHQAIRLADGVEGIPTEIRCSGGVHEEEMPVLPGGVQDGRIDGTLLLLLLLPEIRDAGAGIHAALTGDRAALEDNQVGERGLAGARLASQHEIANAFGGTIFHENLLGGWVG